MYKGTTILLAIIMCCTQLSSGAYTAGQFPAGMRWANMAWCPNGASQCQDEALVESYQTAVDLDLFDTPTSVISGLKAQGHIIICYFSAGTREDWRSDYANFTNASIVGPMGDWPGEDWINIYNTTALDTVIKPIMQSRMELGLSKGCDAVDPDNIDCYQNPACAGTRTESEAGPYQIAYNTWLANTAHQVGLSIGLKNDLGQVSQLVSLFDFALNEQCMAYSECDLLKPFTDANKAVFQMTYSGDPATTCDTLKAQQPLFSPLVRNGKFWYDCLGAPTTTNTTTATTTTSSTTTSTTAPTTATSTQPSTSTATPTTTSTATTGQSTTTSTTTTSTPSSTTVASTSSTTTTSDESTTTTSTPTSTTTTQILNYYYLTVILTPGTTVSDAVHSIASQGGMDPSTIAFEAVPGTNHTTLGFTGSPATSFAASIAGNASNTPYLLSLQIERVVGGAYSAASPPTPSPADGGDDTSSPLIIVIVVVVVAVVVIAAIIVTIIVVRKRRGGGGGSKHRASQWVDNDHELGDVTEGMVFAEDNMWHNNNNTHH